MPTAWPRNAFASPKSRILTLPSGVILMFSGQYYLPRISNGNYGNGSYEIKLGSQL